MTSWSKEKYMKKVLIILLITAVCIGCSACTFTNEDGSNTIAGTAVEKGIDLIAKMLEIVILAAGTRLAGVVGKQKQFQNTALAIALLCEETRQTVGELKQVFVDDWKAENGGKLTTEQIETLRGELLRLVHAKLDTATQDLIVAAGADIEALIVGEAESYLPELKLKGGDEPAPENAPV